VTEGEGQNSLLQQGKDKPKTFITIIFNPGKGTSAALIMDYVWDSTIVFNQERRNLQHG
jgi:hypothetical protein